MCKTLGDVTQTLSEGSSLRLYWWMNEVTWLVGWCVEDRQRRQVQTENVRLPRGETQTTPACSESLTPDKER